MDILEIIIIFFIFSILGWCYEYILFNNHHSDKITKKLFNINFPMLPIYGVGILILFFINYQLNNYSIAVKTLVAFLLLNSMECIAGILSYNFHGYQTWKYKADDYAYCGGYISFKTAIWWSLLSFIFFWILEKVENRIL